MLFAPKDRSMDAKRFVILFLPELLLIVAPTNHAAFAQPSTAGLAFWIDATDLNADGIANNPVDGTLVGAPTSSDVWVSKIPAIVDDLPYTVAGYAENASGGVPTREPMYVASGLNGKPTVRFSVVAPGGAE